jgi:hypothetical protein
LRIPGDVTLPLALEPRHPAIEGGDELEQILKDALIRSGWHGVSLASSLPTGLFTFERLPGLAVEAVHRQSDGLSSMSPSQAPSPANRSVNAMRACLALLRLDTTFRSCH